MLNLSEEQQKALMETVNKHIQEEIPISPRIYQRATAKLLRS